MQGGDALQPLDGVRVLPRPPEGLGGLIGDEREQSDFVVRPFTRGTAVDDQAANGLLARQHRHE